MTDTLLWFVLLAVVGIAVFVALTLDLIDTSRGKPSLFDPPVIVYLKTSPMLRSPHMKENSDDVT